MSTNTVDLPVSEIWCDEEFNTRDFIPPSDVLELADDIKKNGLLSPIHVRPFSHGDHKYKIICGHRRYKAVCQIKHKTIPAFVVEATEREALRLNISENIHRKNLTFKEEADLCRRVQQLENATWAEIGKYLNKSIGWVQDRMCYNDLPDQFQQALDAGIINVGSIREFHKLIHSDGRNLSEILGYLKEIKEANERGKTLTLKQIRQEKLDKMEKKHQTLNKVRSTSEIYAIQEAIFNANFCEQDLTTKVLAWVVGNKSHDEILKIISEEFGTGGAKYVIPRETYIKLGIEA